MSSDTALAAEPPTQGQGASFTYMRADPGSQAPHLRCVIPCHGRDAKCPTEIRYDGRMTADCSRGEQY